MWGSKVYLGIEQECGDIVCGFENKVFTFFFKCEIT